MTHTSKIDYNALAAQPVALLLSGGVDSSVVLHELVSHGVKPDCFYIKIGPEEQSEWNCNSEEDVEMATAVAQRYGCKLEIVDCHREYWNQVTRYTMEKVRAGYTPNPDVMCNRLIKFGAFDEKWVTIMPSSPRDIMRKPNGSTAANGSRQVLTL